MPIALGADPYGFELKEVVKGHVQAKGHAVLDLTPDAQPDVPYYEAAVLVAKAIQQQRAERGIIFCGTGMGVAIVANKFRGIYAGVVESPVAARNCLCINNTNVLTMGGMFVAPYLAKQIVDVWLAVAFTEDYPEDADFLTESIEKIRQIEAETMR